MSWKWTNRKPLSLQHLRQALHRRSSLRTDLGDNQPPTIAPELTMKLDSSVNPNGCRQRIKLVAREVNQSIVTSSVQTTEHTSSKIRPFLVSYLHSIEPIEPSALRILKVPSLQDEIAIKMETILPDIEAYRGMFLFMSANPTTESTLFEIVVKLYAQHVTPTEVWRLRLRSCQPKHFINYLSHEYKPSSINCLEDLRQSFMAHRSKTVNSQPKILTRTSIMENWRIRKINCDSGRLVKDQTQS